MGVEPGVPDLLVFDAPVGPYVGLAIELKIGKGKQTDNQRRWEALLGICGWRCEVVTSIDQAIRLLEECYPVSSERERFYKSLK